MVTAGQATRRSIRARQRGLTELSIKLALDAQSVEDREVLADALGSLDEVERRLQRVWERIRSRLDAPLGSDKLRPGTRKEVQAHERY